MARKYEEMTKYVALQSGDAGQTAVSSTNPLPTARKLIGTQVGTDATLTWADSDLINTYKQVDFTAPATVDQEYEIVVVNPSQDANLVMNIFNAETAIGSTPITRSCLLYGPVTIPKLTPTAIVNCQTYTAGTTTYASENTDINSAGANDVPAVPMGTVEDALYFGDTIPFNALHITIGTAGVYVATVVWEYYDVDTTWKTIPGLVDGTSSSGAFKAAAGTYKVLWTPPANWAPVAVNSITNYWVRARVSAFTSVATAPLLTRAWSQSSKTPTGQALIIHGLFNGGVNGRIALYNDTAVSATGGFSASVRVREVM